MEIEKERVLQMQRLALQREVAQREIDRKRKEEWARRRQAELEGERLKERNALQILKDQHSRLEQELMVMDQRRLGAQASIERQRMVCVEMSKVIRTLHLSREVRLEELRKARGELNVSASVIQLSVCNTPLPTLSWVEKIALTCMSTMSMSYSYHHTHTRTHTRTHTHTQHTLHRVSRHKYSPSTNNEVLYRSV